MRAPTTLCRPPSQHLPMRLALLCPQPSFHATKLGGKCPPHGHLFSLLCRWLHGHGLWPWLCTRVSSVPKHAHAFLSFMHPPASPPPTHKRLCDPFARHLAKPGASRLGPRPSPAGSAFVNEALLYILGPMVSTSAFQRRWQNLSR